jgi:hypothetical protein
MVAIGFAAPSYPKSRDHTVLHLTLRGVTYMTPVTSYTVTHGQF